jgi:uncharacterized protein
MTLAELAFLIFIFFVTSLIGVVTGSNSLITVPVMFQLGIDAKMAIATNMFGLTFMAVGGALPFLRKGTVNVRSLSPFIILTVIGSGIGAMLVGMITDQSIKLIVSLAMFAILAFTLFTGNERSKVAAPANESRSKTSAGVSIIWLVVGYIAVFFLAIYGGLYSGGYVTVLTVVLVAFLGMTYTHSIAATKVINIFSSGIATIVFIYQGLVNFKLGAILAITMFCGAFLGAHYATKMNEVWLRRIFLATVLLLAIMTLLDLARAS